MTEIVIYYYYFYYLILLLLLFIIIIITYYYLLLLQVGNALFKISKRLGSPHHHFSSNALYILGNLHVYFIGVNPFLVVVVPRRAEGEDHFADDNQTALTALIQLTTVTLAAAKQEDLPCKLVERRQLLADALICPSADIFKVICSLEELLTPLLTNMTTITAFGGEFWQYVE